MKFINKIFILIVFALNIVSCGENSALKEEKLYFAEENKDWIVNDTIGENFIMVDNHGISQSFSMNGNTHYFNKSWSSILGINTKMTHTEYHFQEFISSYGMYFSLSLTAGFPPFGDEIYVNLGNISFAYDLKNKTISRIDSNFGNKSKLMTDQGYEENEKIYSTAEIMDSISIYGKTYQEVLHFEFKDFRNKWNDFTPVEIFVAKKYGLVKYILNNGISAERKPSEKKKNI
jgi:hypothetical protein